MIKFKGGKLIITGKDEQLLKREAKKLKIKPKTFLIMVLAEMGKNFKVIDRDIVVEKML